ncbi:helix-turn-helix domain-containing protein, partial [Commensalibacter communis]
MNMHSSKTFFSSNENIFLIPTKTELNFILDQIIFDLKINDSELNFLRYLLQNLKPKNIEDRNFIIAPNNEYLIRKMKCSVSTIQRRIRKLVEAGLIFYNKSPIGRRFFKSKNNNQYGFDLSPLFYRYQEFLEIAEKQKEELHKEYLNKKKNVEAFFENHKIAFLPKEKEKIDQLDFKESATLFDRQDKKISVNPQLICKKSYPQKVKNDHLTNNI